MQEAEEVNIENEEGKVKDLVQKNFKDLIIRVAQ